MPARAEERDRRAPDRRGPTACGVLLTTKRCPHPDHRGLRHYGELWLGAECDTEPAMARTRRPRGVTSSAADSTTRYRNSSRRRGDPPRGRRSCRRVRAAGRLPRIGGATRSRVGAPSSSAAAGLGRCGAAAERLRARCAGSVVALAWLCAPGISRCNEPGVRGCGFDVLGVRGPTQRAVASSARGRRGGRWSPWVALAVHGDHAPGPAPARLRSGLGRWLRRAQLRASQRLRPAARTSRRPAAAGAWRAAAASPAAAAPSPARRRRSPRAAWGPRCRRAGAHHGVVQMAFVHTVTGNDYTPDQSASMVLAIAKYHRDTNG